ncbi:hypothetical protein B0J13DRAFT_634972 [Dactylonectria estremocensis]|uniref:E3 ubiquitin-protein ligase CCNB1IP1 n=1 Tax=Dactylonectria estremocensis TaxID=1079267 RepID=A0A9P9FK01_9HYPO|nr:hypothetical protein B0J13DRAFT_634972 [Dactylonectria estremocensis]
MGVTGQDNGRRVPCLVCNAQLNNPDSVFVSNLNPSEEYKTTILSGLSPSDVMECAGRALSFWALQASQEIYYHHHLYKTLTGKYSNLNLRLEKIVNDANSEIDSLQHRVTGLVAEQEALRRKYQEMHQAHRDKSRKLLQTQELYDKVKRRAEMGDIQQAASDAVDSSLQVAPQASHGFGVMGDHDISEGHIMSTFGQNSRLDMANMNTGMPRARMPLSGKDDGRWPRLGGASRSDLSSTPLAAGQRTSFAGPLHLGRTSSISGLVGTPAPGTGTVRGSTAPTFTNNRVGLSGVGLMSGLKVSQPTHLPGLDASIRHN